MSSITLIFFVKEVQYILLHVLLTLMLVILSLLKISNLYTNEKLSQFQTLIVLSKEQENKYLL